LKAEPLERRGESRRNQPAAFLKDADGFFSALEIDQQEMLEGLR